LAPRFLNSALYYWQNVVLTDDGLWQAKLVLQSANLFESIADLNLVSSLRITQLTNGCSVMQNMVCLPRMIWIGHILQEFLRKVNPVLSSAAKRILKYLILNTGLQVMKHRIVCPLEVTSWSLVEKATVAKLDIALFRICPHFLPL
jgi:hypothetical protein